MAAVVLGSKRTILGGAAFQRKRKPGKSHQRNRSTTNELELIAGTRTIDEDELALPISKTKEEFQSTIALITNNKLNETNSWEVPIVEYFHDMNILRGEDGSINFQTASTTLDGCTKIMSKRVDLIATDADSLLSLMKVKKKKTTVEEEDDDDPDYGPKKKVVKKTDVVDSFNKLRVTDQQIDRVNIDPVFRKMVAEFDEGGTKSLLMNTLRISSEGQVMLDDAIPSSSDTAVNLYGDEDADAGFFGPVDDKSMIKTNSDDEDELDREGDVKMHFKETTDKEEDISRVEALISNFKLVIRPEQINQTSLIPSLDKLRAFMENDDDFSDGTRSLFDIIGDKQGDGNSSNTADTEMEVPEFHVEYDYDIENFDLEKDDGQATNISEDTHLGASGAGFEGDFADGDFGGDHFGDDHFADHDVDMETVTRRMQREVEIMEALDRKMQKRLNRSHWKIRAINSKPQLFKFDDNDVDNDESTSSTSKTVNGTTSTRKVTKKNAYVIDFLDDSTQPNLFEKSATEETRRDKAVLHVDETTLPDLKAWQADRLTECFIQPKRTLRNIYAQGNASTTLDRSYWAERYNDRNNDTLAYTVPGHENEGIDACADIEEGGDGDVDYGDMDMDPGVYDFDAGASGGDVEPAGDVKYEVVKGGKTRSKDTIHYERRVKRINVRLLKRNLWDVTRKHGVEREVSDKAKSEGNAVTLSEVVRDTYERYEGREREDLSTSFFFICMLHIANEEGLRIESTKEMKDLVIRPDTD